MNALKTILASCTLAVACLSATACQPSYQAIEFNTISSPPVNVTIRDFLIEMPAGVGAAVRVSPISANNNEYDSGQRIDLRSQDRDVLTVYRRKSRREFVLVGVNPGTTCLEVVIDGRGEECIDVEISEPAGG
ncbi:MAG: hypothetical protein JKY37_22950 [Nannocystaceae bacterium]|nr:hypothetical protein [Nannocystaceae bacterium]